MTEASFIIAHRGASTEAAENTRTAFLKALACQADGVETDVQLSADGVPVLWHDDDLGKLGLPGHRIDSLTWAELRNLDGGGWFNPAETGEKLLSLAEFLREFAPKTQLLIEVKQRDDEPLERRRTKVRRCLEEARPFRQGGPGIRFLSFDLPSLVYGNELDPDWPYVLNTEDIGSREGARQVLEENRFLAALCLPIARLDASVAAAVREAGKQLASYTCNTEADIGRALELSVDWLISDHPVRARLMRNSRRTGNAVPIP